MRAKSKMRWCAFVVVGLLTACGDRESPPEPSIAPEPAVDEAPAQPTDRAAPDEESPAEPEVSEPTAEPAAPTPPPPAPEPPRPELKAALSPDAPEAVSIHAAQPHRGEEVVLYRVRAIEEWRARERAAGTLEASEARMDEAEARCEQENAGNEGSLTSCYADMAPGAPEVGWERWGTRVYRLMVARVRWNRDRTEVSVLARRALFALSTEEDDGEDEVRVRDMDGDGEPEITVIAAVALPSNYSGETEEGRIGYVLAMSDLHTQFRTSRSFLSEMGDAGPNTLTVETTWRATDRDGDGHADLVVREQREHVDDDEPELPASRRAGTRTVECLWVAADDTWRCPEQLGSDLLERGAVP